MNGKQRLLHNVLGVGIGHSGTGKAPARHRAKHRRQLQQETPVAIRVAGIAGTHQQSPLLFSSIAPQIDPITLIRPPPACRYIFRAASLSRFVMENIRRDAQRPCVEKDVETVRRCYRLAWRGCACFAPRLRCRGSPPAPGAKTFLQNLAARNPLGEASAALANQSSIMAPISRRYSRGSRSK
jgi:hypothetical protein